MMQFLRFGSTGPDVLRVQRALNQRMLPPNNRITSPPMARLVEDSVFGSKTRAMVVEFQRLNGISDDGIVGPDTSYLLFPYLAFSAQMGGAGLIRGTARGSAQLKPGPSIRTFLAQNSRRRLSFQSVNDGTPVGDDTPTEGLTIETSVGPGIKREFQPWFVLKPGEPEGARSFATLTAEATVLRKKGFEFGGQFEFSRQLSASGGSSWIWEGLLFGKYTSLKTESGPISLGLSPVVEAKVRQGLLVGAAVAGEAEATLALSKDLLELSVGGKIGGQWDPHEGNVDVGSEVSASLKLKWDVVRVKK